MNLLIGVTSGIACYKIVDLVRELKSKFDIDMILTKNTLNLIDKKEFERVLKKPVAVGLFRPGFKYKAYLKLNKNIRHVSLAEKADIILVAPATANTIGKIANGIADDLLTTTVMATQAQVIICPTMNCNMWENKIVMENIAKLKQLGYIVMEPETGRLACGEGKGRLPKISVLKETILNLANKKNSLKGKKILVTAGGTSENIDKVRIITNKSSGKMGIAIADEAHKRGADVTLIKASTSIEPSCNYKVIEVDSAKDMIAAVKKNINKDVMIHAAAVSDYTVKEKKGKLDSKKKVKLDLKPTVKIIEQVKKWNKKIFLIGFKADTKDLVKKSQEQIEKAGCDIVVANDVSNIGSDKNQVYIVDNKFTKKLPTASKTRIANKILDEL